MRHRPAFPMAVLLLAACAGGPSFDGDPTPTPVRRGSAPRPKIGDTPERGYPGLPGKPANPKRKQQKAAKRARKKAKRGW